MRAIQVKNAPRFHCDIEAKALHSSQFHRKIGILLGLSLVKSVNILIEKCKSIDKTYC
ncbi:hypothetical protein GCM10011328_23200 [Hafnia psychrotolerans]|uniref:Uncharacterized protein n=1 Tax=Hafnia psychrotolerans TaxID=1477018 RepID=A0ABQ1GNH3_9GAMM|nr:hypothetical protein GCM10011328_23200 [Hafnia psychrotolerans]